MDPFSPENFRLDPSDHFDAGRRKKPPRHRPGQWFLKGPIPGEWLKRALCHPSAIKAALVLWFLAGRDKSREVRPTHTEWWRFGVLPRTGSRGITALERAGLVRVDRHRGRCPIVTLLDVSE